MSAATTGHDPATEGHHAHLRVGWLELFFDLMFVGVISAISHDMNGNPSIVRALEGAGLVVIVWGLWFNVTALTNLSGGIVRWGRIGVFASMAGMGVVAVGIGDLHRTGAWAFVIGLAIARTSVWPSWALTRRRQSLGQLRPAVYGPILGVLWVSTAVAPSSWRWGLWGVLLAVELVISVLTPTTATYTLDGGHMVERIGLFVLIVLGESVVQIVSAASGHRSAAAWVTTAASFALICALWWLVYEATVSRMEESAVARSGVMALVELLGGGQLSVIVGLVLLAPGLATGIEHAGDASPRFPPGALRIVCAGMLLVYLGVASLGLRAFEASIGGMQASIAAKVTRAIVIVAPIGLAWWLLADAAPMLVVAIFAALTALVCWRQWAGQQVVDRWVAAGMPPKGTAAWNAVAGRTATERPG